LTIYTEAGSKRPV